MNGIDTRILNRQTKKQWLLELIGIVLDRFGKFIAIERMGTWSIDTTHVELILPHLPIQFDGYSIIQISDFHFGSWLKKAFLEEAINQVNSLLPDLVVITGDFVSFSPDKYSDDLVDCLKALKPKDQVVAVLGNHDHWSDADEVRRVLTHSHVKELNNRVFILERGGACLYIAGVDDHLTKLDRLDRVVELIPKESVAILLAHEPDFADESASTGRFDLQLSGHSHGGQIIFPFISRFFLPAKARKYPSGLYQIKDMYLYTNRGLGTTWLNLRYQCPPEITEIVLRSH
ncbi:MAG TPA: metallophosphoesterase [Anaerolineales bacterium]|nr:metallophosphoesterase [Anaerolineales bacterium]